MNKFAVNKQTKEVVHVLSTRTFNMARGGIKIRCVEYTDTKPIPKNGCRELKKMPIKMFKDMFSFVDPEIGSILYGS